MQTVIGSDRTINTRSFSPADLLLDSPGVTVKQGNGPRDFGISIRGSNARNGFGIRNIVIFDDGFPVTQPDGLSRSDLIDPHAYGSVDVVRGPSSALYGNYATGGAIDFRTFPGAAIDGVILGTDAGSYGYLNNYLLFGKKVGNVETSVFASNIVGDSLTSHSEYNTQTVNALLRYQVTPEDRLTFKIIENHLHADLSNRLSLTQFFMNPYQRGCGTAATAAPGCQNIMLIRNGFSGATVAQSADQGGFGRNDNRAIFGARWEHDFGADVTWRNQVTVDDRNINQPTGSTSAIGDYPSINVISDVTAHGQFLGFESVGYAALTLNTLSTVGYTYNVAPGGNATLGGLNALVPSMQTNAGGRLRGEVKLTDKLLLVTGVSVERSFLQGTSYAYTYSAPNVAKSIAVVNANTSFLNEAPEISLVFKPTSQWEIAARAATGYGTPNVSNLFVTSTGVAGNNTNLKSQTNIGYDLSATYKPLPVATFTVDGFYEFFRNEMITQSPGAGLQSFTFNAPRSEHRGVEALVKWTITPGLLLTTAYTYDNQIYTQYTEQLSAGVPRRRWRSTAPAMRIPGIPLSELLVRLGYDVPGGSLFAASVPMPNTCSRMNSYIDNANLLRVPGFGIVNTNVHFTRPLPEGPFKEVSAFAEVRNVANTTYVASANNVANTISAANGSQNGAARGRRDIRDRSTRGRRARSTAVSGSDFEGG